VRQEQEGKQRLSSRGASGKNSSGCSIIRQPAWEKDAEAPDFLREAEGLIEGKAAGKKE
jgi:hypothetical protein